MGMLRPALHYTLFCCHRLIRELFDYTREQRECSVIFIDEVDSICRQRTSKEQDLTRRWVIKTYLKLLGYERPVKMTKSGLVER
jgi:SpoVK/Ycf46/Vps4 family AAA+-type ATPase